MDDRAIKRAVEKPIACSGGAARYPGSGTEVRDRRRVGEKWKVNIVGIRSSTDAEREASVVVTWCVRS